MPSRTGTWWNGAIPATWASTWAAATPWGDDVGGLEKTQSELEQAIELGHGQMYIRPPPIQLIPNQLSAQIAERLSAHFDFSTVSLRILYQIQGSFEESCRSSLPLFCIFSGKKEKSAKNLYCLSIFGGFRYRCRDPPSLLIF